MKKQKKSQIQRLKDLYDFNSALKVANELGPDSSLEQIRLQLVEFDKLLFPKPKQAPKMDKPKKKKVSEIRQKILEKKKSSLLALKKRVLVDFSRFVLNFPNPGIQRQIVHTLIADFPRLFGEFLKALIREHVIESFKDKLSKWSRFGLKKLEARPIIHEFANFRQFDSIEESARAQGIPQKYEPGLRRRAQVLCDSALDSAQSAQFYESRGPARLLLLVQAAEIRSQLRKVLSRELNHSFQNHKNHLRHASHGLLEVRPLIEAKPSSMFSPCTTSSMSEPKAKSTRSPFTRRCCRVCWARDS